MRAAVETRVHYLFLSAFVLAGFSNPVSVKLALCAVIVGFIYVKAATYQWWCSAAGYKRLRFRGFRVNRVSQTRHYHSGELMLTISCSLDKNSSSNLTLSKILYIPCSVYELFTSMFR